MAVGSGIGASVGVAKESVYGTGVTTTRFLEAASFSVKKTVNTQPLNAIAAGRPAPSDEVVTTTAGAVALAAPVTRKGFGMLLEQLFGSATGPTQQAATTAYLQTFALADNQGKSLTVQAGLPNTAGTVLPHTALGAKVTQAEFSCASGGLLESTWAMDARAVEETTPLAAPAYVVGNLPFHFAEMTVKVGAFGSEAVVQGVRGASVTIARGQDVERFYAGNGGLKSEPIWNEYAAVTGTIDIDLVNKADFIDRFSQHTAASVVLEWKGAAAIASSYFPTFSITLPKVYFGGETPEVSGQDVLKAGVPFTAFYDLTNGLVSAAYMSTDTAA